MTARRTAVAVALVAASVVLATCLPSAAPAAAQATPPPPSTGPDAPRTAGPGGTPPQEPALPAVPSVEVATATATDVTTARERLAASTAALEAARGAELAAHLRVQQLEQRASDLRVGLEGLDRAERAAAAAYEEAVGRLRGLSVASYVWGGGATTLNFLLASSGVSELAGRRVLVNSLIRERHGAVARFSAVRDEAGSAVRDAIRELADIDATLPGARAAAVAASADVTRHTRESEDHALALELARAGAPLAGTDIPGLFLQAYLVGEQSAAQVAPRCGLRWHVLAAIGRVESNHGRRDGTRLTLAGQVLPRILGPRLTGEGDTRRIADTDGGQLDGDAEVDRAVGPMQFIPSTWSWAGRDGNSDGVASPDNVYDAAVAAAAYLCRAAGDLTARDPEGLRQALRSYNRSESYVATVLAWTERYALLDPVVFANATPIGR